LRTREEIVAGESRFRDALVGHARLNVALLDRDGTALFATSSLRLPPEGTAGAVPAGVAPGVPGTWDAPWGTRYRTLAAWADLAGGSGSLLVTVALDTAEHQELLAAYRRTLLAVLLVAGVATVLLGSVAVHRGLRPLRVVAGTAVRISASHLSERLDETHVPAELRQLAAAFNAMLARLEDSFGRLAGFSSDLAHELRTPINNLMGQTQVALTRARPVEEYRRVLESNLEELERLSRMIADMLFLARADHAQITLRTATVDLRSELDKLTEYYEAHAQERGVRLVCAGEGHVAADRLLVQRAVGNLLSNAIRHAPPGGEIRLRVGRDGCGAITVTVSNPGHGIAREHLDRVFDRFFRIGDTRGGVDDGVGLGLSIVRSIMALHGGRVGVTSVPGGLTTFTLGFPAAGGADRSHGDEDAGGS
jgi:two-component system heavy metal sensor histidine kinase CusS